MLPPNKRLARRLCEPEPVRTFHRSEEWFWVQYSLKQWGLPRDLCRVIARRTNLHNFYFNRESEALRNERIFMQLTFRCQQFSHQRVQRLLSCLRFATHRMRTCEGNKGFHPYTFPIHGSHLRCSDSDPFGTQCMHPRAWGRVFLGGDFLAGLLERRRIIWARNEDSERE